MYYAAHTALLDLISEVAIAGSLLVVVTGIVGLILSLRVRSGVLYAIRLCALVGAGVMGAEMFTFAYDTGFVCFDQCPANIPAALAHVFLLLVSPGIALCSLAWLLFLGVAVRARLRVRALVAGGALPLLVAVAFVLMWANVNGQIVPTTEDDLYGWGQVILGTVVPILLCWPLAVLLATMRIRTPRLPPPAPDQALRTLRHLPLATLLALGLELVVTSAVARGPFDQYSPFLLAFVQVGAAYLVFLTGLLGLAAMRARSDWVVAGLTLGLLAVLLVGPTLFGIFAEAHRQVFAGWSFAFGAPGWLVAQAIWYLPAVALALLCWRALRPASAESPLEASAAEA